MVNRLLSDAIEVIDRALFEGKATSIVPLLSGGHDSISATFVASQHPKFDGTVHHIDTGIGAKATRRFVEELCSEMGWDLRVYRSPVTYEWCVATHGFPGPAGHQFIYNRLKDRCVYQITRERMGRVALITGCRSDESVRRMGHVEPLKIGETSKRTGKARNRKRAWTAPIHNWTTADQIAVMDAHALPRNPIKLSPLGMSGECFCGAFARPYEINLVRQIVPDVAEEIDRLAVIAKANGKHHVWGTRPKRCIKGQLELGFTGPLCTSCDQRAMAGGFVVQEAVCP